jgi:hypothetical protein
LIKELVGLKVWLDPSGVGMTTPTCDFKFSDLSAGKSRNKNLLSYLPNTLNTANAPCNCKCTL